MDLVFQKKHKNKSKQLVAIPFAKVLNSKQAIQIRINAEAKKIIVSKYKNFEKCDIEFSMDEKILRIRPCEFGEYSMHHEKTNGVRIVVHSLFNHYKFMDYERHPIEFSDTYFDIFFGKNFNQRNV